MKTNLLNPNMKNTKKPAVVSQLNLNLSQSNTSATQSQQLSQRDPSLTTKFQFDLYVQQVELTVPSPISVNVQFLKGSNMVSTKKKLKIDQNNRTAKFNEKISLVTTLNKDSNSNEYQSKPVYLKLLAYYNNKEKAIGIANLDLATFASPANKDKLSTQQQKLVFQKCFDKQANITFQLKLKEIFSSIQETIQEENETCIEEEEQMETSRICTLESAREGTEESNEEVKSTSSNEFNLQLTQNANSTKNISRNDLSTHHSKTLSANFQNKVLEFQESQDYTKKLEEKVKKMEAEINFLKKENSEKDERLLQYQSKEERNKDFELKCQEIEQYRQKCEKLESNLNRLETLLEDNENEKVVIIESYEKKLSQMKKQILEFQNHQLLQRLQESQYLTYEGSTQGDDEQKNEDDNNEQKIQDQLKKAYEDAKMYKQKSDALEKQLLKSKEQIAVLVNELYSIEKQNIDQE